jgi:hypothetical protein
VHVYMRERGRHGGWQAPVGEGHSACCDN